MSVYPLTVPCNDSFSGLEDNDLTIHTPNRNPIERWAYGFADAGTRTMTAKMKDVDYARVTGGDNLAGAPLAINNMKFALINCNQATQNVSISYVPRGPLHFGFPRMAPGLVFLSDSGGNNCFYWGFLVGSTGPGNTYQVTQYLFRVDNDSLVQLATQTDNVGVFTTRIVPEALRPDILNSMAVLITEEKIHLFSPHPLTSFSYSLTSSDDSLLNNTYSGIILAYWGNLDYSSFAANGLWNTSAYVGLYEELLPA